MSLEDAVVAELCERIGPEALADILAGAPAGTGGADPFSSCSPDACASCPSQAAGCAAPQGIFHNADAAAPSDIGGTGDAGGDAAREEVPLPTPTEAEREAVFALDHREVSQALGREDPLVTAVATEFIVYYSLRVAEALHKGNEFLHLVKPGRSTPAVESIAMTIVRESVTGSLAEEASGRSNA
jgi:hypothetical protein